MGTKPTPLPRFREPRKQWGMQTVKEFLEGRDKVEEKMNSSSPTVSMNLVRLMVMMAIFQKTQAAEVYHKPPIPQDGSVEFYVLLMLAGVALLGV